jgi:hypothetical protein
MHLPVLGTSFSPGSFLRSFICVYLRLPAIARLPPGSCLTAAGPSAGRDRVLVRQPPDRSRSPELSLIKGENTPMASRTPSRRAGTRALPVGVPRFGFFVCLSRRSLAKGINQRFDAWHNRCFRLSQRSTHGVRSFSPIYFSGF